MGRKKKAKGENHDSKENKEKYSESIGLGIFGGIDIMFAGEGNDTHPVGFSLSLGVGEGLEAHFYGTYTWNLACAKTLF